MSTNSIGTVLIFPLHSTGISDEQPDVVPTIPSVSTTDEDKADSTKLSSGRPSASSLQMDKTPSADREDELGSSELNITDDDEKGMAAPHPPNSAS